MPRRPTVERETPEEHARRRARERYGLDLSHRDYWLLGEQIRQQDQRRARPLAPLTSGREAWLVLHGARWMVCLWCPIGRQIVTFLSLRTMIDGGRLLPASEGVLRHERTHESCGESVDRG
jgi:hypothetical protein